MKRIYKEGTTDTVKIFTGIEIEHTPAIGMNTLFIVGIQDTSEIIKIAKEKNCNHIYTGANMTFNSSKIEDFNAWKNMILILLNDDNNFWVTLDFDVQFTKDVHKMELSKHRRFIPQISVKIPQLTEFNYNATLKIDDTDFEASNAGVWCHRLNNLLDETKFTNWDQYGKDNIIK